MPVSRYNEGKGIFVKGSDWITGSQCESMCNSISTHEVNEVKTRLGEEYSLKEINLIHK
jgi:hypothetical protein